MTCRIDIDIAGLQKSADKLVKDLLPLSVYRSFPTDPRGLAKAEHGAGQMGNRMAWEEPQDLDDRLNRILAFGTLSGAELKFLSSFAGSEKIVEAGAPIFDPQGLSQHQLLLEGWVANIMPIADGRQRVTTLNLPGDMLGMHNSPLAEPVDAAVALTQCLVVSIDDDKMRELFEQQPRLATIVFMISLEERASKIEWISFTGQNLAEARFALFLLRLSERLGRLDDRDATAFEIPISRAQLSEYLGISAVYFSQLVKRFVARHLVEVCGRSWRLTNPVKLYELAGVRPWDTRLPEWAPAPS